MTTTAMVATTLLALPRNFFLNVLAVLHPGDQLALLQTSRCFRGLIPRPVYRTKLDYWRSLAASGAIARLRRFPEAATWVINTAALYGQLKVLQWARTRAHPSVWDAQVCANAARGGHLPLLNWLRNNQVPWDWRVCAAAALGGHLRLLQWARRQDPPAPWHVNACAYAALGGHLELLQWARSNGAFWDQNVVLYASARGHTALLEWARANGAPKPAKSSTQSNSGESPQASSTPRSYNRNEDCSFLHFLCRCCCSCSGRMLCTF